jgi:hypothetical protein
MIRISTTLIAAAASAALISACGGGGDDATAESDIRVAGYFIDAAVSGLQYVCEGSSGSTAGVTSATGAFDYIPGATCRFDVGGVALGQAAGAALVTPVDLVPGALGPADPAVVRIAQFLQSIDADDNPANGIVISAETRQRLVSQTLDFMTGGDAWTAAATPLVAMALEDRQLVAADAAQAHLSDSMRQFSERPLPRRVDASRPRLVREP